MKSNEYRNDIIILAVTLILSVIIIFSSKFIFSGGFLIDKLNKNVEYYKRIKSKKTENCKRHTFAAGNYGL